MKAHKEVPVTETELYMLASEMIMENMPLTNKTFDPKNQDECIDLLKEIVAKKELSIEWLKSAATANVSNIHCLIEFDHKRNWNIVHGMSKAKHTRKEFLDHVMKMGKEITGKNVTVKDKFGKNYFH